MENFSNMMDSTADTNIVYAAPVTVAAITADVEQHDAILLPEAGNESVKDIEITEEAGSDLEMTNHVSIIESKDRPQTILLHIPDDAISLEEEKHEIEEDALAEPLADADTLIQMVKLEKIKVDSDSDSKPLIQRTDGKRNNNRQMRTRSKKFTKTLDTPKRQLKLKDEEEANESPSHEEKNNEVDSEEYRCRVCLTQEDLKSIFKDETSQTIAEKIMVICSGVKVMHKDFLPQYICTTCLQSLDVAVNFKILCEATDKDLRSKLKRSKKKIRRPTEFVLIDCNEMSESDEEAKFQDDDEFHLSNESDNFEQESDSDSSFGAPKRRGRRPGRRRKNSMTAQKKLSTSGTRRGRKSKNNNILGHNSTPGSGAALTSADDTTLELKPEVTTDDDSHSPPKKRRSKIRTPKTDDDESAIPDGKRKEFQCVYCNQIHSSLAALREHKKTHAGEKPFVCDICSKPFKLLGSFNSHLRRHKEEDSLMCSHCEKHFPNKTELRKHLVDVHGEPAAAFVCDKCKRAFTTERRLERHKEGKCPGFEITSGKKAKPEIDAVTLGRDLFKCVAPMTTTYWSDSFSD